MIDKINMVFSILAVVSGAFTLAVSVASTISKGFKIPLFSGAILFILSITIWVFLP